MVGESTLKIEKELNICFVVPVPPPYGGIANWTNMICKYLDQTCSDNIQYCVINTAPKRRVTEGRSIWNRVVSGGADMLRQRRKLRIVLRTNQIDVIHMTTSGSLSLIRDWMLSKLAKKYNVPIVYHIHFGRIPEIKQNNTFEWKVVQNVIALAKNVIAIDKNTYNTLRENYSRKIWYIPNPIDLSDMPTRVNNPKKIVMYLGWVIREKGIEELLQSWGNIYPCYSEWTLRIVGPYKEAYLDYLHEHYAMDGVEFLGEQTHRKAMDLLNESSIFVLPSYTEGCPYVILEAMALGKIVIGTNVGNIPEMLEGGCGCVVQKQDVDMLAQALKKAADDETCVFGCNAREKVCREYEIETIVQKYMQLWMEQKEICL